MLWISVPLDEHDSAGLAASYLHKVNIDNEFRLKDHLLETLLILRIWIVVLLVIEFQYDTLQIIEWLLLVSAAFVAVSPRLVQH